MDSIKINSGDDFIRVNISNSKNENVAFDMKFAKSLTVAQLKSKLEIITGGNAATMQLELYNGDHLVSILNADNLLLGTLPIEVGMRIHVIDNFTWIEDVEKFELTDEQYENKQSTVRNFLKMNRLGKYNEEEVREKEKKRQQEKLLELEKAELCTLDARCEVIVAGNPKRRGTIKYKGPIEGKKGIFIGVQYDEPLGKNNGSLNGKQYFSCPANYGGFVPPGTVEVGDFPPENFGLDDEI